MFCVMIAYSKHFLEQIALRNILLDNVIEAVNNPDQITSEDGLQVYQKLISENNKNYLLRIFVNVDKEPPSAVTAYKTSKLDKYYLP